MAMMTTYADRCLERASRATPGPWKSEECITTEYDSNGPDSNRGASPEYYNCVAYENSFSVPDPRAIADAEFIAHARTDVEELAKRLKRACEEIRCTGIILRRCGQYDEANSNENLVKSLERPLGEK